MVENVDLNGIRNCRLIYFNNKFKVSYRFISYYFDNIGEKNISYKLLTKY